MERIMGVERDSMPATQKHTPTTGDLDVISQWGLVIEGFQHTNKKVHAEVSSAFSLEPAEAETLLRLVRTPGARMPMAKLAREVAFSNGGFTKIADRLAKRSLVQRSPCAEDRRVVYLELSTEGTATANELACFVAGLVYANFVDILGAERAQLVAEAMAELRDANNT
ncbi:MULTISPECIES: MarR family winged helix-turn-helix transcriptional regulator [Pseudarthrobacter]|uniref:MarR family winged helix-turn-helix transcriptional regulator n=1 Tax=Pseudarthrobacter TaxID=1742993 RepID=UPI001FCB7FA0|nr:MULTISPECIES: MarR family transcriptional regulator [Pseudarthrobacter]MDP9998360.1 DNA-binding MarR family transcriptional regulator [Pseudarthrobacter sulfonivorans]